jgi:excisionase family DNA binding protein
MENIADLKKELSSIKALLKGLSPTRFDVPVSITRAAELCEMNRDTLLDMVQRKEIKAYRPGPKQPWRVVPDDVLAYLKRETNLEQPRRQSVLRGVTTSCRR